jgi:calcineurin-like phosphoesterase family protein
MRYWFTSDCHFDHENIIKYCNRPFSSINDMNDSLIENWNERVDPDDMVFHIGDFAFKKPSKSIKKLLNQLNGNIILIRGNHDLASYTKIIVDDMIITLNKKRFQLVHDPKEATHGYYLVLCGHVHLNYKFNTLRDYDSEYDVCNVGVDQWGFYPVSIEEILKSYKNWKKEQKRISETYGVQSI